MPKPKVKTISLKSLRKQAWKLKSELVRREADGQCFTCTDKRPWKEQQAGHYIHKDCLDFDDIGIQCQCVRCNKWLHGNQGVYAERLIKKYGMQAVEELRQRANRTKKFNIFELLSLIAHYQQKLKELSK